jgi:hypothetical protein
MIRYWVEWGILTLFKLGILSFCTYTVISSIFHFDVYGLLAIFFVPLSLFFLYDFIWQILVPFIGGYGNVHHVPSDTPVFMGLTLSWRETKKEYFKV